MKLPHACLAGALALVVAGSAHAQQVPRPADTIHMKNGGLLRGTLVEVAPGRQARIQLVTGEVVTVPWSDVDRVDAVSAPAPSPATAPPPPPRPAVPKVDRLVRVHVEGSSDAVLESDAAGAWAEVCQAPCDTALPVGPTYRFAGGVRKSRTFALLPGGADAVTLHVGGASQGAFVGGIVVAGLGLVAANVGVALVLIGNVEATALYPPQPQTGGSSLESAGWATAAVGVGGLAVGLVLTLTNVRTSVTQSAGLATDAAAPAPTWRDPTREEAVLPRVVSLPLLAGRF